MRLPHSHRNARIDDGPSLATILHHPHGKVDDCDEAPMEEKRTDEDGCGCRKKPGNDGL